MATKAKKKYTYLTKAIQLPDGTRKYIRGKDQKELEEKVLKAQIMVNAGVDICSEETFGHFAQMWYDIYKKPYLRENSQNAIKYVMNQHILPYIGGYRLRDISPMQIQSIMAALSDKSNSLQSKVLIALRSIFKAAQENGLVAKSPVSSMLKPSGKRIAEKDALTPQESDLLLQRVKNERAYTFLLIALQTGMRRGEIVGLQWSDIDFERRMICVRHNAVLGRYETTVSELMKTKAGRRDIPMSNEVEAWLRKQRDRSSSKFVLSLKNKKVMTLSSFRSMWKLIERELPETHITAHILRHPYVKHTTKIFSLRLMDFQAQAYPDARRKTRGACQLHQGGQSQSPVRPLCNRKQLSCLPPQSKISWILYAISMRLSGYTNTRSISNSASSVVSVSASKIALDASLRLSCRACSSCFCFACANTAA